MKQILLVDDEPAILQTLRIILTAEGYGVETAWSSKEAWDLMNLRASDLVVTDFNMPGMKGDELAVLIKDRWPEIPVVMLTASAEIMRASGRALPGVDTLLGKPFDLKEFRDEIARLLERTAAAPDLAGEETASDDLQGEEVFADAVGAR